MIDRVIQEKAARTMVAINAAIRNMRLYPITSTATINSVDKALQSIDHILETEKSLAFAESEKNLLIFGQPLSEKEQQKPQVVAFLDLLLNFSIKNLSFQRGMLRDEFITFLELLIARPEEISQKGGLKSLIAEKRLSHIIIDEKVFVSMDEDQKIASKDEKKLDIEETFAPMVNTLDTVLDYESKDKVSRHLATSMAKKDEQVLGTVLTQKTEGELGEKLFSHIIEALDDEKFERLIFKVRQMFDDAQKNANKSEDAQLIRHAYQNMLKSEKGEQLQTRIRERKAQEKTQKQEYKTKLLAGINSLIKGEKSAFQDKELMQTLPATVTQMFSKGQERIVEVISDRLCEGLNIKVAAVRADVANALASCLEKFPEQFRQDTITRLMPKLIHWISRKTSLTPAVEKIVRYLMEKAKELIKNNQFVQSEQILKAFHSVRYGKSQREENFRDFAGKMLETIADNDITDHLLKEFRFNQENKREQASRTMVFLAEYAADPLLNLLKDSQHRSERARILQLISDIGPAALPALSQRIEEGKPWFFMRNLVLLFGKVGNESHLDIVKPFLSFDDYRVQREVLNCIYSIGGNQRESIFSAILSDAGDQLKADAVGMLGAMECRTAVPMMIQILETKTLMTSKARNELEEKICNALGNLMAQEAIPCLVGVSEPKKGVLSKRNYSEKVQLAAHRALEKIRAGKVKGR
ncbi:MAG: hypothetical protein BWK80_28750 [Desulfobacteraceae bacterium IS3]|nr:MAG: hypothetical protein BWK80_28750 [Desulfobacteraceae bacterium IS3]